MSTTKSPSVHRTATNRLATSYSFQPLTANGTEPKANQFSNKRVNSATNILQNHHSTNSSKYVPKKMKPIKSSGVIKKPNETYSNKQKSESQMSSNTLTQQDLAHSPPLVFHAIAPAPIISRNQHLNHQTDAQVKNDEDPSDQANRRIAHILARTQIKTMSTAISSCSDEEGESSLHRSGNQSSSIGTEADESDHDAQQTNKQVIKSRRMPKNRKLSFSSSNNGNNTLGTTTPPSSKTLIRKDEQRQRRSSSNDDEILELQTDFSSTGRRLKSFSSKKIDHHQTTTTTTDDDTSRQHHHRYRPLENLSTYENPNDQKPLESESNCSSPIPIVPLSNGSTTTKKMARFQVKSIRKLQQQQLLINNSSTAKSSNDDDCGSANQQRTKIPLKPALIERKHTNTPTTDGENNLNNTDQIVNDAATALNTVRNGGHDGHHRVRFQITQQGKQESAAEEEKSTSPAISTATPAPTPSVASAQDEDEEEEEAVGKSPNNRFIKYAKEIGRGAFKTVYRGLDTETSVAVAWCELQDFAQFDKHERVRFKEEAEMLKKLNHPNIVSFYDFWEETNPRTNKKVIILVTELMTSGSLKGYIKNFKGQKEEKRINVMKKWCRQILKGLAYLHGRNPPVIHRDLKCDNVFISSTNGCVKIGDLGLATFKTQTFAKSMRGTMEFMAPEMFDEKYDELVDIYSFGLCMLEMITGEYPYLECKGPTAVIKRVTAGLKPDCYYKVESEDVREVIDCCIRTKKEERLPVHELLQHSFFFDDIGLRIDLVRDSSNDSAVVVKNGVIELKLKIGEKAKKRNASTEPKVGPTVFEAILFRYNLNTDTPEQIAEELMAKNYIFEEEKNFVIQSIKDRLRAYHYEQLDRQAGVFCRDGKPVHNQTVQSSTIQQSSQQQQQQQQQSIPPPPAQQQQQQQQQPMPPPPVQQQTGTSPINMSNPASVVPVNTNQSPPIAQPNPNIEQKTVVKNAAEPVSLKQVLPTETVNNNPLPEIPTSIPGSAGSLQILDAALKKTFTKNVVHSSANASASTVTNDTSETSTPINQDENLFAKQETVLASVDQPQNTTETVLPLAADVGTNIVQASTSSSLQSQSQPSTMLTNVQQPVLQNILLLPQPSQSFPYSTASNGTHLINNAPLISDTIKQSINPSPPIMSSIPDTVDNGHLSISPSSTPMMIVNSNETATNSLPSDSQAQVSDSSLEKLNALLKSTFEKPGKTAGTAHSSDGEAANPPVNSVPSTLLIDNEEKPEPELTTIDTIPLIIETVNNTNLTVPLVTDTLIESTHFDPLINSESQNIQELENLLHGTYQSNQKRISEENIQLTPQLSTSTDELSELKSMIFDLSQKLITKMNNIETKIDDHCQQALKINQMLNDTIIPSIIDLTDIIQQSPAIQVDGQVRTKLVDIQKRIRSSQEKPIEMKDLMDI